MRERTRTGGRGFDLSDEVALRRRRGRLTGWFALFCGIWSLSLSFPGGTEGPHGPVFVPIAVADMVIATVALRRGDRFTEQQFVSVQLILVAVSTPLLLLSTTRGSLRSSELVLLDPIVISSTFCATRRQAALVVAFALAGAAAVTAHRIVDPQEMVAQQIGQLTVLALIAGVVRGLRDSAHEALLAAKRGEITDPLTGLPNRRGFERLGGPTWTDRAADRAPVAVLILDVDHFKRVNDTLGHAIGDDLLRRVADVLTARTRPTDLVVRLGGEEFGVLARTEPGEGAHLAERLRSAIEAELTPVTVSIGLVEEIPEPLVEGVDVASALWSAVALADTGLYEAKRSGRNRVVVVDGPGPVDRRPVPA